MRRLLENLDRKAKRLINAIDNDLQQPTVQILSGNVFTHDSTAHQPGNPVPVQPIVEHPEVEIAAPAERSVSNPDTDFVRKPVLRKAGATNGS